VRDARHHNLKNLDVHFPLGTLTCVTGVSGSGKSSLVGDVLWKTLARRLHRARTSGGSHETIEGVEHVNKIIRVDQQPIGNTPASNPATYTGLFDVVRELFAQLPDAKVRGYPPRRFSFNARGGRCEACEGQGQRRIEMHFLPDVWITCETCGGTRYNSETLSVRYKGRSIAEVLDMSVSEALRHFQNLPRLRRYLETLADVGLDYIKLGQPAPTLSGGEAQRVKLAAELARPQTGRTLYLLDEPTTGLHFDDLRKLLDVLHRLVDLGNTVIVIEHNLDVIKTADWVIDLGPEAGQEGGYLVAKGTPEDLAEFAHTSEKQNGPAGGPPRRSYTGEMLRDVLRRGPHAERPRFDPHAAEARREGDLDLSAVGQTTQMPWETAGRRWHTRERVGRRGEPCRWEGAILERVVDRIHELAPFSETDWNNRTVVEIAAPKKSDGWFFHASTGDEWLVWLRFRVARRTFSQEELERRLELAALDELDELPVYGQRSRVRVKNRKPPWQEVSLGLHWLREIDTPEFWKFLAEAVAGFRRVVERSKIDPADVMPWKVLGSSRAWATVLTKKPKAVTLRLVGKPGQFNLARIEQFGTTPLLDAGAREERITMQFSRPEQLHSKELAGFLKEHLVGFAEAVGVK
jgi:excinuclease ABC subunit A